MDVFVPGRICLMGEHSDWAATETHSGHALVLCTTQGIRARISKFKSKDEFSHVSYRCSLPTQPVERIDLRLLENELLEHAQSPHWSSYISGVLLYIVRTFEITTKFSPFVLEIDNHETSMPVSKGWSSSAAICILITRSCSLLLDLNLSLDQQMECAYQGERLAQSLCGRMDQACAYPPGSVVSMKFDPSGVDVKQVRLSARTRIYMLVIDLAKGKDTRRILSDLNKAFHQSESNVAKEWLGPKQRAYVDRFLGILETTGDAAELGRLMTEYQHGFDEYLIPACPSELSAPLLHRLLKHERLQPYVYGGKGVGSQGDGTAQFICRSEQDQSLAAEVIQTDFPAMRTYKMTIGGL